MTALERVHVVEALITFRAEAAGEPAVQEGEVVVELAWVTPEERDELMPWYRGVRDLHEGRAVAYAAERRA